MQTARTIVSLCSGASTIAQPQPRSVQVTFVVPVRGERLNRVQRLLDSLAAQQVAPGTIEVLLVVNNTPPHNGTRWEQAFTLNQQYLKPDCWTWYQPDMAVHALDLSSKDRWVEDCNVGIARQHGLVTATRRFAERGHNGIVVHTDADCWYEDQTFVPRLLWLFDSTPELIAYGGSYTLEVKADDAEAPGMAGKIAAYQRVRRYTAMREALDEGSCPQKVAYLLGSCAAHRAYEGVLAGGFPAAGICEDVVFGERLEAHAALHGKIADYSNPWGLGPITALRLSDRTDNANTRRYLEMAGTGTSVIVKDVFGPGTTVLDDAYIARMAHAVRALPGGAGVLEYLFLAAPLARIRVTDT
jgi:hypothetical protein